MRVAWAICVFVLCVIAFGAGFFFGSDDPVALCKPDEPCLREWLAATSGWVAVFVAIPTIFYLSKQIRDTERHQRTDFAIQLRKQRILATRTMVIAQVALDEIDKQQKEHADRDMRFWDRETVLGIIDHLRDGTIKAFESEIAFPVGIGAWGTSLAVERGFAGIQPALNSAPDITKRYFENLKHQAGEYLSEVTEITRQR